MLRPLLVVSCFSVACGAPAPTASVTPVRRAPDSPIASNVAEPEGPKDDDLLYLEEISSERALAFARAHNVVSEGELTKAPGFQTLSARLFSIYASAERIPAPWMYKDDLRNFWTDAEHPRGLWRQTTLADYKKTTPTWSTLLDVDALGKEENESYVWQGATCLYPAYRKCLVRLSRGGGDAAIVREFDVRAKSFVKEGFVLPEAKTQIAWKDEDTVFVATDFGPGSLTSSGYARITKEWRRGTPLASAKQIFEVKEGDVLGACERDFDHGKKRDLCYRRIDTERSEAFFLEGGKLLKLDKPDDASSDIWDDSLLLRLRSDWTPTATGGGAGAGAPVTYKKGSLLVADLEAFRAGARAFQVLFEPTPSSSLANWTETKTRIVVTALTDVKNQVTVFSRGRKTGKTPNFTPKVLAESASAIGVSPFDGERSDDAWLWLEDFTLPPSLVLWNTGTMRREPLKQSPSFFDAKNLAVTQHFAVSKDKTRVPYFEIAQKNRSAPSPTILYAYGGFEISMTPSYAPAQGAAWLERGGVYVLANIRGGGEYGPAWHQAAMKRNRQNAYDDLAAVAEDLVARGVTTTRSLGISGGSNGGLLTSVMLTQRPELFGAVVSMVPLTDMRRYHKLLAGSSWMGEYGDPDDEGDWAALAKFSPLQNAKKNVVYPPVLFTTSTKDDRVHPGHARKMVAKLEGLGHKPLYYENIEGGHGGAADVKQRAHLHALIYTFLSARLGLMAR